MASPVWFCGAPADPVADHLARRVVEHGLEVTDSPSTAERALVVLSPDLAAEDPPELREWIAARGVDSLVLAVSAGRADWDDETDRFEAGSDALPPALHALFPQRPILVDLRGASDTKLDRCAQRIAGAVSSKPPPAAAPAPPAVPASERSSVDGPAPVAPPTAPRVRAKGRPGGGRAASVGIAVLLVALLAAVALSLRSGGSGGEDAVQVDAEPTTVAPPTTVRTGSVPTPSTARAVPTTDTAPPPLPPPAPGPAPVGTTATEDSSNVLPWVLVLLLAAALGVALVLLARRSSSSPPPRPAQVGLGPAAVAPVAPTASQVFISHDTEADGEVAHRLADRLRRRELRSWLAPDSIPPGEPWVFAIEQGLLTSRAALVLVSPAALASGWVRREIQMIVDLEIDGRLHVVPVRVEPCELPLYLGAYQWVEVENFDRAADELARRFTAKAGA